MLLRVMKIVAPDTAVCLNEQYNSVLRYKIQGQSASTFQVGSEVDLEVTHFDCSSNSLLATVHAGRKRVRAEGPPGDNQREC